MSHSNRNGMVSLLEGTQQLPDQPPNSDVKVSNSPLKVDLAKLSKNSMKNVYGIRMRYEQNLKKNTLHGLLGLNPECQIKVLEENLKFLFQEDSTYNYFQIKSNHLSLMTGSRESVVEPANKARELNPLLVNSTKPSFYCKGNKNEIPIEKNKTGRRLEGTVNNSIGSRKELFSGNSSGLSSNMLKDTKRVKSQRVLSSAAQISPLKHYCDKNGTEECYNSKKDADNQYEFTVEEENIVSFVCSTSPPDSCSKETGKSSSGTEFSDDQAVISDHDSDCYSKLWTGCNRENVSLLESPISPLCESNTTNTIMDKDYLPKFQQTAGSSKLLWHPPTSLSYDYLDNPKSKPRSYPTVFGNCSVPESVSDVRVSLDSACQRNMESSFSRETTLFRETSLRGCYNMENIVKGMTPPYAHVEQELKQVRESIFSAVRSQKSSDDLVSDSILSILDICKSWLKLSSHLKDKAFVDTLQSNGTNLSILNDFLQWQCVSRVFIDKMIDTLQKITPKIYNSNISSTLNDSNLIPNGVKNCVYSSGLHNMHNKGNSTNTSQSGNDLLPSKCEINLNKNWKQRRFFMDQPKQLVMESKIFRPNCSPSNTYNNIYQTHSPCSGGLLYGQGDPPLSYNSESHLSKINHPFPVKNSFSGQGDVNFSSSSILNGSVSNIYQPDKNLPCISNSFKHFVRERDGTKPYQTSFPTNIAKEFTLSIPMNPQSQANTSGISIVPPFYNNQMCYTISSNYQLNPSQFTAKQNPIQCTDSDTVEMCTKSSYMKPGSYNIPEKPVGFQKIINNNIPIEDSPVVGVPFLFSGAQGNTITPKAIAAINTTDEKQISIEYMGIRESEEKWKAAMTSAETFRDSLISCKTDSRPNTKLSDTVSLKTHFLLSDEFSQGSSINDFKLSSESEEFSPCEQTSPAMDVSIVEAKVKTSDWLMQSFNRAVQENERDVPSYVNCTKLNVCNDSEFELNDIYKTNLMSERLVTRKIDEINRRHSSSCSLSSSQDCFQYVANKNVFNSKSDLSVINAIDTKLKSNDDSLDGKKPNINNNKLQDDLSISRLFDDRAYLCHRKAKSGFNRSITKPISSKLEDILNCICSTEVSSLAKFGCKSEKEVSKLEIKIRCPLYLQAMRCKLANQSYDTLDQALCDFQKYFIDIRNRNKGDKQSTDIVGALEHLFLDLVEKHFGSCQPYFSQYFRLRDLSSTGKPRKSTKIPQRF